MHNQLYDSHWQTSDLFELIIKFESDSGDDIYRTIILDKLAKMYPSLAKSIYDYAQYELNRIDGNQKSINTIFGNTSRVKSIFSAHLDLLTEDDIKLLGTHGIDALAMDDCNLVKRIRSIIKTKFNEGKLTLDSAKGMQSAFGAFCSHYKLPEVKAFGISDKKRKANEDKLKALDYYTIKDVASIAYAIELGLKDSNLTQKDELFLRLGRILIKTGWNLSPVLMLEIDDILKLDVPVTGKTAHFVRLFKKRAGYKTQFYEFELDEDGIQNEGLIFGANVINALADLEYIRDKISSNLRSHLTDTSKLKYRLCIYRDKDGIVKGPTHVNFSHRLNEIIMRYDCKVQFNVQRIRKGGLNYVYKKYAKNFKEYQKAGQHSLKMFLDVYLRDEGVKSEETLASATSIMSDYFSGRPISEDIIIVTEVPADTKQTPTGRCASHGNDFEAEVFSNQQQRLNRSSESESSQCGDFNACLFCRHFRVVADAEHVWRLLSYHHFVLAEMERGISDYESTTDQAEYIDVLNNRIETILAELNEINSNAVETGKYLLKTNGCHEDWAFFVNVGIG